MYDVCIIGAGVVGCAIARELSRYDVRAVLVDMAEDVSQGASKANSGIVHGGYTAAPGTLKGELCTRGNRMFGRLDSELHFGYRECGSLVLALDESELEALHRLYRNGIENSVAGLEMIGRARAREIEPNVNPALVGALRCDTAGVTSPYELTIALAENAVENGVELRLRFEVSEIEKGSRFTVIAGDSAIEAGFVVNAAGVASDKVAAMVGAADFSITPRRGEYVLFQKGYGALVSRVIFQVPSDKGKGVLVTGTFHGNLLIGPNAEDIAARDNVDTSAEQLMQIVEVARKSVPSFDLSKVLTTFAGVRASSSRHDFIIEESRVKGFFNVAGIESPGLTASPAIAERVVALLRDAGLRIGRAGAGRRAVFSAARKPIISKKSLSDAEVAALLDDPTPRRIVCRCEQVTEAEILDAMRRGVPVETVDAVKRRTRAGMGRCQGNFCRPRVKELIAQELGIPASDVVVREDEAPRRAAPSFYRGVKQGVKDGG